MTQSELIAALEKATGPSRDLDEQIADAFLPSGWLAPRFTASIDAALTLVPDNAFWSLSVPKQPDMSGKRYWASLHAGKPGARGATPAIALCIAALKAMEATDDRR